MAGYTVDYMIDDLIILTRKNWLQAMHILHRQFPYTTIFPAHFALLINLII